MQTHDSNDNITECIDKVLNEFNIQMYTIIIVKDKMLIVISLDFLHFKQSTYTTYRLILNIL
jgi:hypothetical protein